MDNCIVPDNNFEWCENCEMMRNMTNAALWTEERVAMLIALFREMLVAGKRSGLGGLKKDGWNQLALSFNTNAQTTYSKLQLQSRINQLKRNYFIVKALQLNPNFNWDESTCLASAPDNVWMEYFEEHPEAAPFRSKPLKYFRELDEIFSESFKLNAQSSRSVEQLEGQSYDNQLTEDDSSEHDDNSNRPSKRQCCGKRTVDHGAATPAQHQDIQQHQTFDTTSPITTKEIALRTFRSMGRKLPVRVKLTFAKYLAMTDGAAVLFNNIDIDTQIALIAEVCNSDDFAIAQLIPNELR